MSQKNSLELYIAQELRAIDKYARPTRGSGAGNELRDIFNYLFFQIKTPKQES